MRILSHPADARHLEKPLTSHLLNVANGAEARIQRLSLNCQYLSKTEIATLAFRIGLYHDLGKASSYFQQYLKDAKPSALTKHSLISAILLYYDLIDGGYSEETAAICFKAVQRHHGNLQTFGEENLDSATIRNTLTIYEDIQNQLREHDELASFAADYQVKLPRLSKAIREDMQEALQSIPEAPNWETAMERFLIQNLLFSVLVDADKSDAARWDIEPDAALKQKLLYSPDSYLEGFAHQESELNQIRTQLRQAAANCDMEAGLYAMSAPTGSGKTLACMAFAQNMQAQSDRQRRLIYCLPYTSIIDQNHEEFRRVLNANSIDVENPDILLKHHHLVDYSRPEGRGDDYNYQDFLADNMWADSWNAACIVSTFVQLFHTLIGSRNSMLRKLHNIFNSIILLDEVQSLPPKYYLVLRQLFSVLATRFDTHILSCTATQPALFNAGSFCEISPTGLFDHEIFNRVKLKVNLENQSVETFAENLDLQAADNALLVMNTKRSAITLYQLLHERFGHEYQLYCLTTLHTPFCRKCILNLVKRALKRNERIILISTQLIEAGVDISFKKVYRDLGPLDSIVQVAGRCNRNTELGVLGGEMEVICLEDDRGEYCKRVYDNYILEQGKTLLRKKQNWESKDFAELISNYYQSIDFEAASRALLSAIKNLNYDAEIQGELAIDRFKLIEDTYATNTLYILHTKSAERNMEKLLSARDKLKEEWQNKEESSKLRLQMAQAYQKLSAHQINLSDSEIKNYSQQMAYFQKMADGMYYIQKDDVAKAYSSETGFLYEPLDQGSVTAL
ncbi:MAG: CRISPR-associated helicase Cas3' [Candidatus Cloacimonetes bacterium]|nr:CRISPR-associated helicase Cas3' [Candidatus Cloacimonadota bacterium]